MPEFRINCPIVIDLGRGEHDEHTRAVAEIRPINAP
jgi:hypothetical protein